MLLLIACSARKQLQLSAKQKRNYCRWRPKTCLWN